MSELTYRVEVKALTGRGTGYSVGEARVTAPDRATARERALAQLWDPAQQPQGARPHVLVYNPTGLRLRLRCHRSCAITGAFTDGELYEAWQEWGKEYTRLWWVRDDRGVDRAVLPDEPCAHLAGAFGLPAGWFETVEVVVP